MNTLGKLVGTTGKAMIALNDGRHIAPSFFKPYKDKRDVAYGLASVVAAPFCFTGCAVAYMLLAIKELLNAIKGVVTFNFSEAKQAIAESSQNLAIVAECLLATALSPLINFIGLIGSVINSRHTWDNEEASSSPTCA